MTDKKLHIVFQVLNFLHGTASASYSLPPTERLLLINFASHLGKKGIYPSISCLQRELNLSRSQVHRVISQLEQKGLIKIDKHRGKLNRYILCIPEPTSVTHDTGVTHDTSVTHATVPVSPMRHTSRTHATHRSNPRNNKGNNPESRARVRAPLSEDFVPKQSTVDIAQDEGLTIEETREQYVKFMDEYVDGDITHSDWDRKLGKWFRMAGEYKRKKAEQQLREMPGSDRQRTTGQVIPLGNILEQLRQRTEQGGSNNGNQT